ncbi:NACHT, LRR and PYD domains-containing protein 12-like [Astatotilapia calliptera]|uniref:NACHT, LRR and PYD domains-containing protein 12-like n=1 Tax=Astatotilapia calliptera TaxID=8154 RepID=UPI000E414B5B|nr:NACHT, LRR and PYD domains-containing protein 12-like [Astatotilapia calliptera]XP_026030431.1 NACHT, LRR and PYD domains-containing protein 12-like [Astatotilapia calliptera]
MTSKELLLRTLEELGDEEFSDFKWYLEQPHNLDGLPFIPKSHLENVKRTETVDKIVQTYNQQSLEVVKKTLTKISRNDLTERLSTISTTAQDVKSPRPITRYKEQLQSNLQVRFMCKQEGWTSKKDEKNLDDIYTDLYITAGGETHTTSHFRQIEMASGRPAGTEISNIFIHPSGIKKNIRTVLTAGEAGSGKTFLVHKFVLDWAEKRTNQDVDLLFPFMFNELNLQKDKEYSFAKLIHMCIPESVHIKEEELNSIFTTLQTSGNSDFEKSEYKLLFVLDGLNESCPQLNFTATEKLPVDVTKSTSVDVLLTNLITGCLLPSARIWMTTWPGEAISVDFIDMVTEVRGFTELQREEYFRKRFRDEEKASRIISHIKSSPSLHFMCHIPVYCWSTATVLQEVLKSKERGDLPETLTEVYTEFLNVQIRNLKQKYGPEKSLECIKMIGKLAFNQLEKSCLIFSEELTEDESTFTEPLKLSNAFFWFFKEDHQLKKGRKKVFSFVHQSVVEFLAALFVVSDIITEDNLAQSQTCLKRSGNVFSQTHIPEIYSKTVDKAIKSLDGHLDLFLRFLLGLSQQTNKPLLQDLLQTRSSSQTIKLIVELVKKNVRENPSPERRISLFLCLNELKDGSPVEEIQQFLRSGTVLDDLSPAQWSALVFIILSSQKDLTVFDLKEYSGSEKAFLGLLPVVEASNKALFSCCNLSERSYEALCSLLSSQFCSVSELDLSNNKRHDSGVKLISAVLNNPHCKLQTVRLNCCNLSERSCEPLCSLLSSKSCNLRELDLSNNKLQDSGMKLLSAGLKNPHCKLETLRLSNCNLSERSCNDLFSVLRSQSCSLKELDLSNNKLWLSGKNLHESSTKTIVWTSNISKYKDIISNSDLTRSGPPPVYQLNPKKKMFGTLTKMTVGEKNQKKTNKTILLVGETGAGKSTLINALVNYTMGVKWEDEVWFKIVEEEEKSQSESQTSDVIVYEIFGFEDETLPYSLTIIDTPGYGDTRGIKHDIISQQLLDLFGSENGVHEVHALGLVMKMSDYRLSDRAINVFDSVMSLFGENMEKNVVALITHSDGRRPKNAFRALEAANIKCAKNEKNQPVHFLFNSCQHEERTEENEISLEFAWTVTERGMREFTAFLEKGTAQRLMISVEVLNERIRLTTCIQNLKDRCGLTELKQFPEGLKKNKNYRKRIENLLGNPEKEIIQQTADESQLLNESYKLVVKLDEQALKADSASSIFHLDFLIEKMKEKGDTEKVQKLEEMRSRVDEGTRGALRFKQQLGKYLKMD